MKRVLIAAVFAAVLSGCAWRTQISHSTVSTAPFDINGKYEIDRSKKITGADRAHGIWLIPLGSPDASDAVKNTLAKANQTSRRKIVGIADTEVKFKFLWLYLYSQRWYSVEGYPIYEKR